MLIIQDQILKPYNPGRTLDDRLPRQQQTPYYFQNGLVYAFRLDMLLTQKSLYGKKCAPMIIDWSYFLDIDTPSDLEFAEYKLNVLRNKSERE